MSAERDDTGVRREHRATSNRSSTGDDRLELRRESAAGTRETAGFRRACPSFDFFDPTRYAPIRKKSLAL